MLSKKQWALRPSHAALRLFPRWQGGWPAAAQAAWSRNAMPRRLCLERKMSWWISGEIFLSILPFPYLERHMAQPTPWKTEVKQYRCWFSNAKICHKFPSVHIWTNMSITCTPSELSRILNGGCLQWYIILFYTRDIFAKKWNKKLKTIYFGGF
jgi:hypothetical protein